MLNIESANKLTFYEAHLLVRSEKDSAIIFH